VVYPLAAVLAHLGRLFSKGHAGEDGRDDDEGAHFQQESDQDEPVRLPIPLTEMPLADLADDAAERHDWRDLARISERLVGHIAERTLAGGRAQTGDELPGKQRRLVADRDAMTSRSIAREPLGRLPWGCFEER